MFKHYYKLTLWLFLLPIVILLTVFYFTEATFMSEFHGAVAAVCTNLFTTGLLYILVENKLRSIKNELQGVKDEITILLRAIDGQGEIKLPAKIRRRDFTRAEVLGRIGMVPLKASDAKGFKISYTNASEFIEKIHAIYESEGNDQLVVACTQEELQQFDAPSNPSGDCPTTSP